MRTGFSLVLVFALVASHSESRANTYYVASNRSDANNGLSAGAPFQSLAKVNSLNFLPGDQVLFRSGDTFRGQLNPAQSGMVGNPITIAAYGAGSLLILSGTTPVANWTNIGGNLWQASFPAAGSSS